MNTTEVTTTDVIVLGVGVGGESVGGQLAEAGLEVVGIEAELVGGECPYWGCIPSKMMLRAANLIAETRRVPGMAGESTVTPDWTPVAKRIREEATDNWDDQVAVDRFVNKGGRLVRGKGRILSPTRVEVPGAGVFEARRALVIATGTEATIPPIPGLAGTPFWTNREAIETETLPESLIVIGGGAIGCELGQVFARFGSKVTIVEAAPHVLPAEDPEVAQLLTEALVEDGIRIEEGRAVTGIEHGDAGFTVHAEGLEPLNAKELLIATGRRPRIDSEEWAALGLEGKPGFLPIDDRLRVVDGVWAIGDTAGAGAFTHMATYHADIVAREILGKPGPAADHHAVPRVTFTDPEIGSVGLSENQADSQGLDVVVGSAQIPSTSRGWIHKVGNSGAIKVIIDPATDTIVGAASAGPNGGEVLGALAVAVHARVPVSTLESMIYAYPTFHRGISAAIADARSKQA